MSPSENVSHSPKPRKNSKFTKTNRHIAPLLIAGVAVLAAVIFSVSVESRSSGWLWKAQPTSQSVSGVGAGQVANKSNPHSNSLSPNFAPGPRALPVASPTVTATKTDSLFTDVDMDGKADPGDTLKYTVAITATGADANGVTFTDTVDPNTTFVAGTLRTTPLARNDSYSAAGNIRITVAAPGVLANDSDPDGVGPAISATAGTFLSVQGGNVALNADGSFTYNPPAGFEGTDTFTYTLNDNDTPNNTDTGTVSISVSGMIWFINNNASCPCDGRLTNPFNTLAAFQAVNDGVGNHPAANDNIFVYESAADYLGSVILLNGQKFIGQDATDTLSNISGVTPPAGSDPLPATSPGAPIVNITSAGTALTLGVGNTLRGFTGGNAVSDIDGTGFGTLSITDVTLNGNGRALSLSTGTLAQINGAGTATFGSISSNTSTTTGISLTTVAGALTTGSTTVSDSTGIGISVNTSSATLNFANTSVTGSGGTGVSLTTNTGAITFGSLGITPDAGQRGLLATDNTNTITTTSGTIGTTTGTAVEITRASSTTPLSVALTSISSNGAANGILLKNTSGSFTVVGDGANTTVGGNFTGGTISNATGADGATAGNGVYLENAGNVTLRRIRVNGTNQNHGIRGVNFSNFTLEFSTVTGTNGTSSALHEGSVNFDNLTGTAAITSCFIDGGLEDNLNLVNSSGSLNRLTISGSTFGFNNSASGNNSILIESQNAGTTLNFTLKSSLIKGARTDWINATTSANGTMDAVIGGPLVADGNTFDNLGANAHPSPLAGGNRVVVGSIGNVTADIRNNTMKGSKGEAIRVRSAAAAGPILGLMNARVRNNTIGVAGTANSGSSESFGIFAFGDGGSSMNIAITNNQVFQYNNTGINMQFGDQSTAGAAYNATVTGNTVSNPGNINTDFNGIQLNNGTVAATDNFTTCADIGGAGVGNNVAGSGSGVTPPNNADIRLRQRQSTTVRLPGYGGANNDNTAVVTYLTGRNTLTTAAASNTVPTGGGFVGGAACTAPSFAGPITQDSSSSLSSESLRAGVSTAVERGESTLFATKGENTTGQHVVALTQSELSAMVQAAISRWAEAGMSAANLAKLQSLPVEIADLPAGQLATATSSKITLDESAAGYGWFFDATPSDDNEFEVPVLDKERQTIDTSAANGRIDLLTVLMRQFGAEASFGKSGLQGAAAWLMQGTLDTGERRAPAFKVREVGKVKSATDATKVAKQVRATNADQQVASSNAPRNTRVLRNHAMRPAMTVADVILNIGTLPAGKTITITFNATVKDPFPGPGATVCNQGTVSGTNFANVLTDDPDVGGAADPTCTAIDLQADLAVTKADSPDPVIAGNNITYTINFTNNGPNASGATVTDATPVGTTFVSASVTTGTGWGITNPSVGGTGNVVFSKASVASGESAVFEIVVKVNSSVAGGSTINNSATAATTGATDPVPGNNTGNASTSVIAQADLSITKTDGATTEIPGTSISYTIVVSNAGPSDANGVSVSDSFPSDLTGVSYTSVALGGATGNTAGPAAGNISDTVNMPAGSSITYTVNATIKSSATGSLSNTATVTAPVGVTDPTLGNNSATDTDTLTPQANLSITKTDGVASKVPGTSVTYTIVVTNSGPSDAPGTTVADTFPATLTGVSYTSVAAGGATGNTAGPASGNISDTLSMPSGSSVTYTVNATIQSSATGSLSNTATVTEGAGVTDPNQANNSATDTDTLTPQADLSITKTDGVASKVPGTSVTYTIVVSNSGPSDAPGTTVADTFPATLTGVSYTSVAAGGATGNTAGPASGNISDTLSMPSGSSVTYTVNATIQSSATGSLSNTATVTAGVTDPTPGNNSATDTDTLTPSADVSVTKTDSPDPVIAGNNITYTITVTNNGPSDAQSLSLSDAVPANTTLVSVTTPAGWTRTDAVPAGGTGTLTFTRPTQAASASSIFTVVVNVTAGTANGTTITNTANVSSTTADATPGNNSATATTLVQNNADLAITKSVAPTGPNDAGTNVTYTIDVINNGPAPASNVSFSDVVPAGTTVVSQTNPAGWTCNTLAVGTNGTITCTKASVGNGETAQLTVVAKISCSVANGTTISNTATISSGAGSPPDNNTANNTSTAMFTVNNPAVTVTASVTMSQLPQNSHDLINVGLSALASGGTTNCPPGPLTVQVFGDEDDQTPTNGGAVFSPDAKDIAVGTLRLRGERVDSGNGRVYLIVVRSGSSFATVTVVVPKSSSPANVASVNSQAAAAKSFADANNGAPPAGYFVIGDGPIIGNKQ